MNTALYDKRVPLGRSFPVVLGMGAFLKNTVTLIDGDCAYVSHDAGHTDTPDAVIAMEEKARRLIAAASSPPGLIAHDLHPDFPSTRIAALLAEDYKAHLLPVQHHSAHIAAVAAEHNASGPLLGLALDGFGLGAGNAAWGGELLLMDGAAYRRLGSLRPLLQPGGDVAAREPWRMAAAALHALGRTDEIPARWPQRTAAAHLPTLLRRGINCPPTSSAGRLFDAACGLLDVCPISQTEGQAPIALERLVSAPKVLKGGWHLQDGVLDLRPLLSALADIRNPQIGAELFHGTLSAAMADWVTAATASLHLPRQTIVFSGGCFYNKVISADLRARLTASGLSVLEPKLLGPGDPAISLGQAYVAAFAQVASLARSEMRSCA